jgi:hypothetical protein
MEVSTMSPAKHQASSDSSAPITPRDAYLAMYYFVRGYWERGGKRDGNVTLLLNAIGPFEDPMAPEKLMTTDPAFWDDWLTAVEQARTKGLPAEL